MSKTSRKFLINLILTVCVGCVVFIYSQYIACLIGILTALLRIKLFWVSEEGDRFSAHEVNKPKPQRQAQEQQTLELEYEGYIQESKKNEFWRKPPGMIALIAAIILMLYLDKKLIFYTFLTSMLATWLWFQGWLEWRIKK